MCSVLPRGTNKKYRHHQDHHHHIVNRKNVASALSNWFFCSFFSFSHGPSISDKIDCLSKSVMSGILVQGLVFLSPKNFVFSILEKKGKFSYLKAINTQKKFL
jgi:hypothetical protein